MNLNVSWSNWSYESNPRIGYHTSSINTPIQFLNPDIYQSFWLINYINILATSINMTLPKCLSTTTNLSLLAEITWSVKILIQKNFYISSFNDSWRGVIPPKLRSCYFLLTTKVPVQVNSNFVMALFINLNSSPILPLPWDLGKYKRSTSAFGHSALDMVNNFLVRRTKYCNSETGHFKTDELYLFTGSE